MKLTDYIRGDRSGGEANRLEREALDDPFLNDALEGYEAVQADHPDIVRRLEDWVGERAARGRQTRRRRLWGGLSAAAVVLVGAGAGLYMYNQRTPGDFTIGQLLADSPPVEEISRPEFESGMPEKSILVADALMAEETVAGQETVSAESVAAASASVRSVSAASMEESDETDNGERKAVLASARMAETSAEADEESAAAALEVVHAVAETVVAGAHAETDAAGRIADTAYDTGRDEGRMAAVTRSELVQDEVADTVVNREFAEYFARHKRLRNDSQGKPLRGDIVVEFRVNDAGVPSAVRIVSSFSQDANREVIELLVEGPRWTPTHDRRIRAVITYE